VHFSDPERLLAAYQKARADLLRERTAQGHWVGELASSALATATAVSALALVQRSPFKVQSLPKPSDLEPGTVNLEPLIQRGIDYLAAQQNADGGFGDTDLSHSNIATTMLVRAAFYLAREADSKEYHELLNRAQAYIITNGGITGLRARYGKDRTFAVPILTNCALAGLVEWSEVSPLPFELAAFPQSWYRFFRLPVVSYAIPALVAIGQARYFALPPRNPVVRALRRATIGRTLEVLRQMQPDSGGYLEAVPLTSFVIMSLAGTGRANHAIAQRGVKFLLDTMRPDGSWPIDTNLATWVTTLAVNAIHSSECRSQRSAAASPAKSKVPSTEYRVLGTENDMPSARGPEPGPDIEAHGPTALSLQTERLINWLLSCQHIKRHPFTGADPGGWGWSDLSGAVPDVDDTAGALLALATFAPPHRFDPAEPHGPGVHGRAYGRVLHGILWLLKLQNRDGGWPTFCRGWGRLPFDRSSPDLTAHALRAIVAWLPTNSHSPGGRRYLERRINRGLRYLAKAQRPDGSWVPLWFGNQDHPAEENPVYGTARVLLAYRDLSRMADQAPVRGVRWLIANQNSDGGWGAASPKYQSASPNVELHFDEGDVSGAMTDNRATVLNPTAACGSSIEETAWALEGMLAGLDNRMLAADNSLQTAIRQGVDWLMRSVEDGLHCQPAPVGFYFAKLWYYEMLYPLIFTVSALSQVVERLGLVEGNSTIAKTDLGG
jgi:squalene-hopene/tetraprenyl-beta-curcumene cyclase